MTENLYVNVGCGIKRILASNPTASVQEIAMELEVPESIVITVFEHYEPTNDSIREVIKGSGNSWLTKEQLEEVHGY